MFTAHKNRRYFSDFILIIVKMKFIAPKMYNTPAFGPLKLGCEDFHLYLYKLLKL